MTPGAHRVRLLLARRQALENRRAVPLDLLVGDAAAEGLDPGEVVAAVDALAEAGLAMRVEGGWTLRPPAFPADVTSDRAQRVRLFEPLS